jgi:hypothetical protein
MKRVTILVILLSSISVQAQIPVRSEFTGNWFFNRAEIQEKPAGSWDEFETRETLLLNEFTTQPLFKKIPTHIAFHEGNLLTYTAGATWFLKVFASLNDAGEMEFRDAMPSELSYDDEEKMKELDINSYPLEVTFINPTVSGDIMLLQYFYYRNNEEGDWEGMVTIFYNK